MARSWRQQAGKRHRQMSHPARLAVFRIFSPARDRTAMPITIVPPAEPSPAKLFALQQNGRSSAVSPDASVVQKREIKEQGEAGQVRCELRAVAATPLPAALPPALLTLCRQCPAAMQDLIATFIASNVILPSSGRTAAIGVTEAGQAAQPRPHGGSLDAVQRAPAEDCAPMAACTARAVDASPVVVTPPPLLPPSAHSTTEDVVAEVAAVCEDASLAPVAGWIPAADVPLPTASALTGPNAACRALDFVAPPPSTGHAGMGQHPQEGQVGLLLW